MWRLRLALPLATLGVGVCACAPQANPDGKALEHALQGVWSHPCAPRFIDEQRGAALYRTFRGSTLVVRTVVYTTPFCDVATGAYESTWWGTARLGDEIVGNPEGAVALDFTLSEVATKAYSEDPPPQPEPTQTLYDLAWLDEDSLAIGHRSEAWAAVPLERSRRLDPVRLAAPEAPNPSVLPSGMVGRFGREGAPWVEAFGHRVQWLRAPLQGTYVLGAHRPDVGDAAWELTLEGSATGQVFFGWFELRPDGLWTALSPSVGLLVEQVQGPFVPLP